MWERAVEKDGKYVYLSISLIIYWFTYLAVSVVELVAFVFYLLKEFEFPRFYFSTVGYWGSLIAYFFGPLFAVIHLLATLESNIDNFPGSWTLWLIVAGSCLWLIHGLLHIFFVPEFLKYIDAQPEKPCVCELPHVAPLSKNASELEKVAFEDAQKDRATLCLIQCPLIVEDKCPIFSSRNVLTAEEYDVACAEIIKVKNEQAEEAEAAEAADSEDDGSDDDTSALLNDDQKQGGDGW